MAVVIAATKAADAAWHTGWGWLNRASSRAAIEASSASRAQIPIGAQRISAPFDWLARLAAARAASPLFTRERMAALNCEIAKSWSRSSTG